MCPLLQSAGGGEGSAGQGSLPHSAPERRELPPQTVMGPGTGFCHCTPRAGAGGFISLGSFFLLYKVGTWNIGLAGLWSGSKDGA